MGQKRQLFTEECRRNMGNKESPLEPQWTQARCTNKC